jgi:hypothetical protein
MLSIIKYLKLDPYNASYKDLSYNKMQILLDKIERMKSMVRNIDYVDQTDQTDQTDLKTYRDNPITEVDTILIDNLGKIRRVIITYFIYLSKKSEMPTKKIEDKLFIKEYNEIIDVLYSKSYNKIRL